MGSGQICIQTTPVISRTRQVYVWVKTFGCTLNKFRKKDEYCLTEFSQVMARARIQLGFRCPQISVCVCLSCSLISISISHLHLHLSSFSHPHLISISISVFDLSSPSLSPSLHLHLPSFSHLHLISISISVFELSSLSVSISPSPSSPSPSSPSPSPPPPPSPSLSLIDGCLGSSFLLLMHSDFSHTEKQLSIASKFSIIPLLPHSPQFLFFKSISGI